MLLKAFIESQFSYCLPIWMLHSRTLDNNVNCLHKKALKIAQSDFKAKFDELMKKDGSFST